ncbi:putative defensin-like protein 3 [Sesamum indicum]|uniref:Defensin-like protein 3 n=1 Tax=Sesamum indicum TaxID=4182 RepID=A0A6I9TRV7_SESIN|nr:putative defensin-like protein 3 [Sesamum indicum]
MTMRLFDLFLLVLLVSCIGAEAAVCQTRSQQFRGLCFRNDNCAAICEKEGYISGSCKGFLLRCICFKDCGATGGGPPDGSPDGDGGTPEGLTGSHVTSNISSVYKYGKNEAKPGNAEIKKG